jgi:Peptidyl-tRNA hydrolase
MQAGQLRLLVGLGNPGDRYHATRHNVGFMVLEALARRNASAFRSMAKLQGQVAEIGFGPDRLRLLMPHTFMNESGRSIRGALDWLQFDVDQVLVVVDDMDLPLGTSAPSRQGRRWWPQRLAQHHSASGHRGLCPAPDWHRCSGGARRMSVVPAPCPMCLVASAKRSSRCWIR